MLERYSELAGQVHDPEEASVADMLVDLNLTTIEMHVKELREVEDALARIRDGDYGTCIDCGGPIGVARLKAYPTAVRCIRCQDRWEATARNGQHARALRVRATPSNLGQSGYLLGKPP